VVSRFHFHPIPLETLAFAVLPTLIRATANRHCSCRSTIRVVEVETVHHFHPIPLESLAFAVLPTLIRATANRQCSCMWTIEEVEVEVLIAQVPELRTRHLLFDEFAHLLGAHSVGFAHGADAHCRRRRTTITTKKKKKKKK